MINFNWIDLFSLFLLIRIGYKGFKSGLFTEIFRLLATLVSIVTGLHFLDGLSSFIKARLFMPEWLAREFAIIAVFFVTFLAFFLLRVFVLRIMTTTFVPQCDKTGAIGLGITRGFLTISIVLLMLNMLPSDYVQKSLWQRSSSAPQVSKIAPAIYKYLIKFMPNWRGKGIFEDRGKN